MDTEGMSVASGIGTIRIEKGATFECSNRAPIDLPPQKLVRKWLIIMERSGMIVNTKLNT